MLFAVRTTVGREEHVLDKLLYKVRKENIPVKAAIAPKQLKGYIMIEADEIAYIEDAIRGVQYARGVVRECVKFDEIQHFLTKTTTVIRIEKGDTVELISGPFKGEKARVIRVDKTKNEVTVELIQVAVPIPVTIKIDSVTLATKKETEPEEEE